MSLELYFKNKFNEGRIKQLNKIIPTLLESLPVIKDTERYAILSNRIEELKLEYKERTGKIYKFQEQFKEGAD